MMPESIFAEYIDLTLKEKLDANDEDQTYQYFVEQRVAIYLRAK